jgi:condensin complex subunit 2
MRGQRVRFNEAGDGEVDENFWAQAAADQAAGRMAEDDESEPLHYYLQHESDPHLRW